MIFSVGYQRLPASDLEDLMSSLRIDALLDVRGIPRSRFGHVEYNQKRLEARLGKRYEWQGELLGNKAGFCTGPAGLTMLEARKKERLLLMCLEHAPGSCHRHHHIAAPLLERGILVRHVFNNIVVTSRAVERAYDHDVDPRYIPLSHYY